jgi:nuclease HARBI1
MHTRKRNAFERLLGIVDGTVRRIARPGKLQQAVYNGHKKYCGLKYQGLCTPDGMIAGLGGPFSGRMHGMQMLRESKLVEFLEAFDYEDKDGQYYIYGDSGYIDSRYLFSGFEGAVLTAEQKRFNYLLSQGRIAVEWSFGKITNLWRYLDNYKNQKTGQQAVG